MAVQLDPAVWQRVLVIAPHPDDESLATGGLLQQVRHHQGTVRVVYITYGDNNPWPQRTIEHRWRLTEADRQRWGQRRRDEALTALATLGVSPDCATFLGYPDQRLTTLLLSPTETLSAHLANVIAEWRPTLLVAPSLSDVHPDHSATALLVRRAMTQLDPSQLPVTILTYVIHGQTHASPDWQLSLSADQQRQKRAAITCHRSQMVFGRRRLLAFAQTRESFVSGKSLTRVPEHPVCMVGIENTFLRIEILGRFLRHAVLPATLYLVNTEANAQATGYAIELPRKSATVSVREATSGKVVTSAEFWGDWRRGELLVPLDVCPRQGSVFVKLTHRYSFFDVAGWREIAITPVPCMLPTATDLFVPSVHADPVTCCVIPCYNEAGLCEEVVRTAATYVDHVIAVNDGSTDDTGEVLERIAQTSNSRIRVLHFTQNRGKGAALCAAFQYALAQIPFDVLVTCDGDRQHRAADIPRLVRAWQAEQAALVIGERETFAKMPLRNRLGNTITSTLLHFLYPGSPLDTQSGLRALDRQFVEKVVQMVNGQRYETELDILLLALEEGQHISTVPIPAIYLQGNRFSHYRPLRDSLRIYRTLVTHQWTRWWHRHTPGAAANRFSLITK